MRLLIVLAAWIGAADLLLLLPVGLEARFGRGRLSLRARIGPVPVALLPRRPKKEEPQAESRGGRAISHRIPGPVLRASARRAARQMGRLWKRTRLKRLRLHFTAGGDDPCRAVMAYAWAGIAMEYIGRLCARREGVDLRTEVDIDGATALDAELAAAVRLGYILGAGICICFAILREYYRYKKRKDDA